MRKPAPIAEPLFADPKSVLQTQAWKQHFGEQGDYYEQVLRWVDPFHARYGMEEPPTKYRKKGLIAYADGAVGGWNPGEGAGEYWWNSSAWNKIPRVGETATTPLDASWMPPAANQLAPIWDKLITGAAVTSVTTDGEVTLDGNAHGGYEFEFIILNNSGSTATYRLYYNNDTTVTNYNYNINGGGIAGADAIMSPGLITTNSLHGRGSIIFTPAGHVISFWPHYRLNDNFWLYMHHKKIATIANLTRIDIVSSVANGIDVNSRFRLWRRK